MHKRHNPLESCELKFAGDDESGQGVFEGYASTFNNVDAHDDTVLPGAYKDTLQRRQPLMLYYHDPRSVIGKWTNIAENEKGLYVVGEMTPNHTMASDVYASLKHGALSGLSIGYRVAKDGVEHKTKSGKQIPGRFLSKIDLFEISILPMPADKGAQISGVKAEIEAIESIREAELFLRESEFSKSSAVAFVNRVNALARRDAAKSYQDEISELKSRLDARWMQQRNTTALVDLINRL